METPEEHKKIDWKPWIAVGAIAVLVGVFGYGIYRLEWDGTATRVMSRVVPYPAAIVDGSVIRWSEFQEDVRFLEDYYEREKEKAAPGSVFPTHEEIEARVLDRLVKERLAEKLARRYDIAVSSSDVNAAFETSILDQAALDTAAGRAKAEAKASATLQERYGLSSARFKDDILYPFLVRRELETAIRKDAELNVEKRKKAETALAALDEGMEFREAALTYSEDPTVVNTGGDRGVVVRGLLPRPLEDAAFALGEGETSGIVETDLGYHVVRVTERTERGGEVVSVRLHEILVRPISLDDYLEAQKKRVTIITFVK